MFSRNQCVVALNHIISQAAQAPNKNTHTLILMQHKANTHAHSYIQFQLFDRTSQSHHRKVPSLPVTLPSCLQTRGAPIFTTFALNYETARCAPYAVCVCHSVCVSGVLVCSNLWCAMLMTHEAECGSLLLLRLTTQSQSGMARQLQREMRGAQ